MKTYSEKYKFDKLLSTAKSNAKTIKNEGHGFNSRILYLAPSTLSGFNTCQFASAGCARSCLNSAGRGAMSCVQKARINKTKYFFKERKSFLRQLTDELDALEKQSIKNGLKSLVRLNGTSDLPWLNIKLENGKNVFESYPNIQFYDYTKSLATLTVGNTYLNYHVTFSQSESNQTMAKALLENGHNIAVVFDSMPSLYKGSMVVDGTKTDLRNTDPKSEYGLPGYVIGLLPKGKARKDQSGFVIRNLQ